MDVQCERCKTEYEFDDALVSGRGTTVRCTNCGHQFKVRKSEVSEPGVDADRWQVRTQGGQDLTFLTLRELQRAILAKQVGRSDVLRRGQASPRALGTIAELEPFFEGRASSRPPPPGAASQVPRIPPPSNVPRTASEPPPAFPKRTAAWGTAPAPQPPVPPPRRKIRHAAHRRAPRAAPRLRLPWPRLRRAASAVPVPLVQQVPHTPMMQREAQAQPVNAATPYAFGQASQAQYADDPVTQRRPPTPAPPQAVWRCRRHCRRRPFPSGSARRIPRTTLPDGRRSRSAMATIYAVPSRRRRSAAGSSPSC